MTIDYTPANYEPGATPRRATVRPYLLEPSLQTHALYLIGLRRGARRDPHVQDRAHRDGRADAAHVRAARPGGHDLGAPGGLGHHRGPAAGRGRAALRAGRGQPRAARRPGTRPRRSRPRPTARCAGGRRSRARSRSGSGSCVGRRRRGRRAGGAARRRGRHAPARPGALRLMPTPPPVRGGQPHQRPDPRVRRADQAPRRAAESALAGLPDEDVAEEDLLDTAWLQRLRRISQLQSARWVFPTAEHSRFTHGLGVMHEAGLWARSLYPSLRGDAGGGRRAAALGGPRRRDAADGRPAPRRRARTVRPLLRRPRAGRVPGARPTRAGRPASG